MPRYTVQSPDGRQVVLEGDTPPTEQDLDQVFSSIQTQELVQEDRELGISGGKLTSSERFFGGFRSPQDLEARRNEQRRVLGITEGIPLEPTGVSLENLADLPNDVLDMIGPAFPAVGQIAAGIGALAVSKSPQAGIAAGAGGSAGGEALRQFIGKQLGFEQGSVGSQMGRVGTEGAIGAVGEVGGRVFSSLLRSTKVGIVKASQNILSKKGVDGFVKTIGKIAPDIDPAKTQFAIDSARAGDHRIFSPVFADDAFALKHGEEVFFGGKNGNIIDHIGRLGRTTPVGQEAAIPTMMKEFLGIPENITRRVMEYKGAVPQAFKNPNHINKLGEMARLKLDRAKAIEIDKFGRMADQAIERYGNVKVDLTDINTKFMNNLKQVGIMNEVNELNPAFKGSGIDKVVSRMLETFSEGRRFRGDLSKLKGADLASAINSLESRSLSFDPSKSMRYSELVKAWKTQKNAITRDIFQQFEPKVTRPLAQFFDDVTSRMAYVGKMEQANKRYGAFMRVFRPIEEVMHNDTQMRQFLKTMDEDAIIRTGLNRLETLMPQNLHFTNEVLGFNAVQKLLQFDQPVARAAGAEQMVKYMDSVFNNSASAKSKNYLVDNVIDPGLPRNLRFGNLGKVHSTAKALNSSARSLLRARFLAGGLGISAMLMGGPIGVGMGSVAAGLVLQDPRLFGQIVRGAARIPVSQGAGAPVRAAGLSQGAQAGTSQLLSALLRLAVAQQQTQ